MLIVNYKKLATELIAQLHNDDEACHKLGKAMWQAETEHRQRRADDLEKLRKSLHNFDLKNVCKTCGTRLRMSSKKTNLNEVCPGKAMA